jgi:hypothetical protein
MGPNLTTVDEVEDREQDRGTHHAKRWRKNQNPYDGNGRVRRSESCKIGKQGQNDKFTDVPMTGSRSDMQVLQLDIP